jgi:hypothetical protein
VPALGFGSGGGSEIHRSESGASAFGKHTQSAAQPPALAWSRSKLMPNTSFKRRATGVALGPRSSVVHHLHRGPSATPASPA